MKVTKSSRAQMVQELTSGKPEPCSMEDCESNSTHLLVVEAHGDNTTFAIRCCETHFKYLQAELSKAEDHLYTKFTTGDKFFFGGDES